MCISCRCEYVCECVNVHACGCMWYSCVSVCVHTLCGRECVWHVCIHYVGVNVCGMCAYIMWA